MSTRTTTPTVGYLPTLTEYTEYPDSPIHRWDCRWCGAGETGRMVPHRAKTRRLAHELLCPRLPGHVHLSGRQCVAYELLFDTDLGAADLLNLIHGFTTAERMERQARAAMPHSLRNMRRYLAARKRLRQAQTRRRVVAEVLVAVSDRSLGIVRPSSPARQWFQKENTRTRCGTHGRGRGGDREDTGQNPTPTVGAVRTTAQAVTTSPNKNQ